nr:PREDICTED: serine/threonine-protein kinase WARTS homolog [Lepisosteus oculatus]
MGADVSNHSKGQPLLEDPRCAPGWRGLLSSVGLSFPAGLCRWGGLRFAPRRTITEGRRPEPPAPEEPFLEWPLPGFISLFLPEFPHRSRLPGPERFQILGCIAKGSYGPILKVRDRTQQRTYAVKVLPKCEILRHGVLAQSKEEVTIQRQVRHPFLHTLQDCWQTQRHLFIMCEYCSTGDLYTYWTMAGRFGEEAVRVFAAELGSALGFLHDFGIIHRDVKMENVLLNDQDPTSYLFLLFCSFISLIWTRGLVCISPDFGIDSTSILKQAALAKRCLTVILLSVLSASQSGTLTALCRPSSPTAPEVLSGGPYNHAADWWSLGVLLFSLATGKPLSLHKSGDMSCAFSNGQNSCKRGSSAVLLNPFRLVCPSTEPTVRGTSHVHSRRTGSIQSGRGQLNKFPVAPRPDHRSMLQEVRSCGYEMPDTFSPELGLLISELLCQNPMCRLRRLERFRKQPFFRGVTFDPQLLQKTPVCLILELKQRPDRPARAGRGLELDVFKTFDLDLTPLPGDVNRGQETAQGSAR